MNQLDEKLRAYGVNWHEVMERFVDDQDLYDECLRSFMNDPSFSALEGCIKGKEYDAAFDCAHTLKGVAGNLGLTPLYKAVCRMIESLRHGQFDTLTQQCAAVLAERETLCVICEETERPVGSGAEKRSPERCL